MGEDVLYLIDLNTIQLDENSDVASSWVHSLPLGDYTHPAFGKIQVTLDRAKRFAENIKNKVRGIDPSINYNHNNEDIAAGWVKDAEARDTGLWLFVEWTKTAVEKIKNKEYRYFSAEYNDKWQSPDGKTFQDVVFGGALTNRPFMKNLLPINLSESTVSYVVELADAIRTAKATRDEVDVDLKKLNELLGLPVDTSEELALAKLAELKAAPSGPDDKKFPKVPEITTSSELKKLAEENPVVRALVDTVDAQNTALAEFKAGLLEAEISKKLSEFDASKIILTPVAKDRVHDFLTVAPVELHEQFWGILSLLKNNSGLMVELGERAGSSVRYGTSKDSVSQFMDQANALAQEKKISLDEAMTQVSQANPALWNEYRKGSYSFQE